MILKLISYNLKIISYICTYKKKNKNRVKTIELKDGIEVVRSEREEGRKRVHSIILLDASGSMGSRDYRTESKQSKYEAAINGINEEIKKLKESTEDVDVLMSIYEFDSNNTGTENITEHCFCTNVKELAPIKGRGPKGNTPLYQSIAYVIETFFRKAANQDKVLLSIFTDGAHNCFWGKYGNPKACKDLIKDAEENRGFVITFVGKEEDTIYMIDNLNLDVSNTLSYDGSAKGMGETFKARLASTKSFLNKVAGGQSVERGFYQEEKKKDANKS